MKSILKFELLDKFILKQIIEVFLLGIVIFTSIVFASDTFISLIKQISTYGMTMKIATMIILLNLPAVIVMTIPMSVLFSTVMTINKMCLQSEITILKACGISINRISKSIFLFSVVMAFVAFYINEAIVPMTMSQSKTLALYSIVQRNIPEGKKNFSIKELSEGNSLRRLFYVENCEKGKFENVTILDLSKDDKVQILQSKTGTSVVEGWQFDNASVYTISKKGKTLNTSWIEKSIADFGTDIQRQLEKKDDGTEYNIIELLPYLNSANYPDMQPKTLAKYQVHFWEKLALPVTTIIFVLIGVPLAITPPRVRHNRGLLFTIGVLFLYYVIRAFSFSLGYNGVFSPFIAANLPNIIIGIIGFYLYYRKGYRI